MTRIENEIKILVREEYKYEFEKIEREKLELQLENDKYKRGIKELSQIKDLNSPEAKKIINSLINY